MTKHIVCVGETLVDFLAQTEVAELSASKYFERAAGGAVSNVSVGIARLGGHCSFIGAISRDPFGKFLLQTLARDNVNVDGTRLVDAATTLAFVARGPRGARDFLFVRNPGADSVLEIEDLDRDMIAHALALHFGGVLLASEPGRSATLAAAELARESGALVSFDPNVRRQLFAAPGEMRMFMLRACALADIVKLSIEDMQELGLDDPDPIQLLQGRTTAVVTTDAHGCRWFTKTETGDAAAPPVDVVDTTGAGDAFMAALLWRIVYEHGGKTDGSALSDAARYACAAGALACRKEGAIASLPKLAEVEAALNESQGGVTPS